MTLYRVAERRAGVRRRDGAVVVGARLEPRPRRRARRTPACSRRPRTCSRTWARTRRRPRATSSARPAAATPPRRRLRSRRRAAGTVRARRPTAAAAESAASRSRRTAAPPGIPPIGRESWSYHVARLPRTFASAPSTTAAISARASACDAGVAAAAARPERRLDGGGRRRRPVRLRQRHARGPSHAPSSPRDVRACRARPGHAPSQVLGRPDRLQGTAVAAPQRPHRRRTARRDQPGRAATRPSLREPLRAAQAGAQGRASSDRRGVGSRRHRPPHRDKNSRSGCWRRGGADGEVHVNEE